MQNTTTTLQVAGSSPEGTVYWGRVWSKIDREWIAPQVNIRSGRPLQVVLAFRIERDGGVKNLAIEQSSGNEYYDVAAKRAVLNATPLPPFASDMPEPFYDIQFQFTVNVDF
jgi:TonB family protein